MVAAETGVRRVKSYCALCISRRGSIAVVEDGRLIAQEPDPSHPTGSARCAKGRAAPEIVYSPDRLLYPMKRTWPKGDPDPGWQRISWDEALDLTASRLRQIADESGPHTVAFSQVSASTSAISDAQTWIQRLMRAFGSVNLCGSMELCGWGRSAARFAWGTAMGLPGSPMPELEKAACILFWGYNPSLSRISHATATVTALKRGARLIVVDPMRIGMAQKADVWLQVRPGTDAALALGIANVMIQRGWYDRQFIERWSNGALLVRSDTGRLLRESDIAAGGSPGRYVAWDAATNGPIIYDPATRRYEVGERAQAEPALLGAYTVQTLHGELACGTGFDSIAEACRRHTPEAVAETCGVRAEQIEEAARLLWEARPVSYYAWSGVEQQTGSTQIARAISLLYALTGCFDAPGGNVQFPSVPVADVVGTGLPSSGPRPPSLGPSGVTLEALRAEPGGIRVPLEARYRKYAEEQNGVPRGFATPSGLVELYSETLLELHPAAAAERGIATGTWVIVESPDGAMRARARLNRDLDPGVVCGEHGWWQACEEIGAPSYDPFADDGSNYNLLIGREPIDPVSGSAPLRAYLCQVRPAQSVG